MRLADRVASGVLLLGATSALAACLACGVTGRIEDPRGGGHPETGGMGEPMVGGSTGNTGGATGGGDTGGNSGDTGGRMGSTGGNTGNTGGSETGGMMTSTGGVQGTGGMAPPGGVPSSAGGQVGTDCGGIRIPMGKGPASGGTVGVWQNVTPQGISLNGMDFSRDNFGFQDVLVDPVRPSDLYAFVCHQGVWKSTDYGLTWKRVNTGRNGTRINDGKPWGEGIDTNRCRNPNIPPMLYSAGSQNGFWRSADGGVSWDEFKYPMDGKARTQDAYNVDVDPYDGRHLLSGFHEESGLAESFDSGTTWRSVPLNGGMNGGTSWYPFFIDTGDPATTRKTYLMITQTVGGVGTWRSTDGGGSWTKVMGVEHNHGASQIFQWQGVIYLGGVGGEGGGGVYRSTDFGGNWTQVSKTGVQTAVFGTANYIYAQPSLGGNPQATIRAAQPGTTWMSWPQMTGDGPKRAAVTHDGTHYIIVAGNWLGGLWRYVEP